MKVLFFELDEPVKQEQMNLVLDVYFTFGLDLMIHQTGNGIHFLSPSMIPKEVWKVAIDHLRNLNKKCPMTTLRMDPNKYPNEERLWIPTAKMIYNNKNPNNSFRMSEYLNVIFKTSFFKSLDKMERLKIVRYPLPLSESCR